MRREACLLATPLRVEMIVVVRVCAPQASACGAELLIGQSSSTSIPSSRRAMLFLPSSIKASLKEFSAFFASPASLYKLAKRQPHFYV